ncbi:ExbD/TolR family protein [Mucilaginibacter sp. AW1-3]
MAELNSSPEKTGGKTPRKKLNARVDLTAMVDLAFLLITFFMLTTSLQKPKMFNLAVPDNSEPGGLPVPASRSMTIDIGKDGKVLSFRGMPDQPLTEPKVTSDGNKGIGIAIIEMKKLIESSTNKDMIVLVKASDHSVYNNLVNVLDEMSIAGIERYAVTDIQPKDVDMLKQHNAY